MRTRTTCFSKRAVCECLPDHVKDFLSTATASPHRKHYCAVLQHFFTPEKISQVSLDISRNHVTPRPRKAHEDYVLSEDENLNDAVGASLASSSACRDGNHVDALDRRGEEAVSLRSHDVEFDPELRERLRSLGLKLERTFLTTISSQGSEVRSATAKSAPPGF